MHRPHLGSQAGLAALELVVAVTLMATTGVLSAAGPARHVQKAELAAVEAAAAQLQQAMEMYAVYNGDYPPAAAIQDYAGLRATLGDYVNLPEAARAPFEFAGYTAGGGSYTLVIRGRDAAGTRFTITPAGVTQGG